MITVDNEQINQQIAKDDFKYPLNHSEYEYLKKETIFPELEYNYVQGKTQNHDGQIYVSDTDKQFHEEIRLVESKEPCDVENDKPNYHTLVEMEQVHSKEISAEVEDQSYQEGSPENQED